MKTFSTIRAVRAALSKAGGPVVLVPTMGGLHAGHAALVARGRKLAGKEGMVVVSVFVNPTQFGPNEDFSKYPRTLDADKQLCKHAGADCIFAPSVEEMYPGEPSVFVDESRLSLPLCGATRPGHFRGVCTVVAKLFLITDPDISVFGEKDWQQLAVIRRMVRDLNFRVKIAAHPTVRESDGLAMSSRNAYLNPQERLAAPMIHKVLKSTASGDEAPGVLQKQAARLLERIPGARLDYVQAVDAETLEPLRDRGREGRLAAAVFLGKTRLIDNVPLRQKGTAGA